VPEKKTYGPLPRFLRGSSQKQTTAIFLEHRLAVSRDTHANDRIVQDS